MSLAAIALGITAATVVATLALDVGDQVSHELRSFGANIAVTPAADSLPVNVGGVDYRPASSGAFLRESDLPGLKKIFWANNVVAFAPFLYAPASLDGRPVVVIGSWFDHDLELEGGQSFRTGLRDLHPAWKLTGLWPDDRDAASCLAGAGLARSAGLIVGSTLTLTTKEATTKGPAGPAGPSGLTGGSREGGALASTFSCRITGILETDGAEDEQIIAPLAAVQNLAGEPGRLRRLEVSALTKPEDDFARRDPKTMSADELERWSCSPYVRSIAYQIAQVIPGSVAKPVYPVADTEGRILSRIASLMLVLAVAALATACLAVASMMLATVIERRAEIGLFQSLGATRARVAAVFLLEGSAIGLGGGSAGYLAGTLLAHRLGTIVFGVPAPAHGSLLPLVLLLALLVTWVGSAVPLARGLKTSAAVALRD